MHARLRIVGVLFILSIVTAGGSILYLSNVARHAGTTIGAEYPAPSSNDAYLYGVLAKNIVTQHLFSENESAPFVPDTFRTPGYPLFVAVFYALFGSFYPVLIAQMLLVFLTSVLVFKMAEKIMGLHWGAAAAALYILLPSTLLGASILLSDNFFVFVFIASIYVLLFSDIKNVYARWVITGLLLALAAYIRPVALYVPIILIPSYFLFYRNNLRLFPKELPAVLLFVLMFIGVLSPWYIRNHSVSGVWGFSSVGTFALFDSMVPDFLGTRGVTAGDSKHALRLSAGLPTDQPSPLGLQYSGAMQKAALKVILGQPVRFGIYYTSTLPSFFVSSGAHDYWRVYADMMPNSNIKPEPSLAHALNPFSLPLVFTVINNHGWFLLENVFWTVITLLAFVGAWRSKNPALGRIFLLIIIYFALVTGPISHARYRMPVDPLLIIAALSAATYVWETYRKKLFLLTLFHKF